MRNFIYMNYEEASVRLNAGLCRCQFSEMPFGRDRKKKSNK